MSHVTLAQDGSLHHVIHASCAMCVLTSLRLTTLNSSQSLSSSFSFSWSSSSPSMWIGSEQKNPVRFREWGVWPFGQQRPLTVGSGTFAPLRWMSKEQTSVYTVRLKLTLFLWTLVFAWMVFPLFISAIGLLSYILLQSNPEHGAVSQLRQKHWKHLYARLKNQSLTRLKFLAAQCSCHFKRKTISLRRSALHFWRHWSSNQECLFQGRSPTMRHASRIHRVALDWLIDGISTWTLKSKSNTSIPKTNSSTFWRIASSFVMNWIIISVCSTFWTTQCFHVAIPVKLTTFKPCRRGRYRKEKEEKSAWLQNWDLREM